MADTKLQIIIQATDKASEILRNIGKQATDLGKSLSVKLTAPIAGVGIMAVKSFGDWETSMSNLKTIIGSNTGEIAKFDKGMKELLQVIPKSANDLGASAYNIVSAGITDANQALNVLRESGKLAVAGLGETAEAVDLMTSALNAYQIPADMAERVSDILFKTVKQGKTDVSQLAQSFGQVAPIAKAAGVSLIELQAATAALTTAGVQTSVAQTQLKALFQALLKPSGDLQKVLTNVTAQYDDITDALSSDAGLLGVLQAVKQAVGGNEQAFLGLFPSIEASGAALALTGAQMGAFKDTVALITDKTNILNEAFEVQNKTFDSNWQKLKNNLNITLITLGKDVIPILINVINGLNQHLSELTQWWESLSPGTKKWLIILTALIAALGPLLIIFGQLSLALALIPAAIGTVATMFGALTGAISTVISAFGALWITAGPWMIAGAAVIAIIASVILLIKHWEDFKEFIIGMWTVVSDAGKRIWTAIMKFFEETFISIADITFAIWNDVKTFFTDLWEGIKAFLENTWKNIENTAIAIYTSMRDFMVGIWEGIKSSITGIWNAIKDTAMTIYTSIRDFVIGLFEGMRASIVNVWNSIKQFFVDLWDSIKQTFESAVNAIMSKIQPLLDAIEQVKSGASAVFGKAREFGAAAVSKVRGAIGLQHGGIVNRPTFAMIGEAGPEAVVPLSRGRGFAGVTVNVHISGNVVGNRDFVDMMSREMAMEIKRQMRV